MNCILCGGRLRPLGNSDIFIDPYANIKREHLSGIRCFTYGPFCDIMGGKEDRVMIWCQEREVKHIIFLNEFTHLHGEDKIKEFSNVKFHRFINRGHGV